MSWGCQTASVKKKIILSPPLNIKNEREKKWAYQDNFEGRRTEVYNQPVEDIFLSICSNEIIQ
jgi:hypothetical protein